MAGIEVEMFVDIDEPLARFQGMRRRSYSFKGILREAQRQLARAHARNWDTQGAFSGKKWAKLDKEYSSWKLNTYGAQGVLVQTGELKNSLTRISGGRGAIREVDATSMKFGTSLPSAAWHLDGTDDMPARKILFVPKKFGKAVGDAVAEQIVYGGSAKESAAKLKDLFGV